MSTSYNPSNSLNIDHNGWKNLKTSLLSHHGDDALLKVKTLDNNYKKLAAANNNIVFLHQYIKLGIVPKGLNLKFVHKSREIQEFMKKVSMQLVKKIKTENFKNKHKLETQNAQIEEDLRTYCPSQHSTILQFVQKTYESSFESIKISQKRKLRDLAQPPTKEILSSLKNKACTIQCVKNISSEQLNKEEMDTLSLGLNFAVPRQSLRNDFIDTIINLENRLNRIEDETEMKNNVRTSVANIIEKETWTRNLTPQEALIIKCVNSIKNNKKIIVNKADKGNLVVIMNKSKYMDKISSMLRDKPYKLLPRDPTADYEKTLKIKLQALLNANKLSKELYYSLVPKKSACPRFYGAPKVHKPNCPLRPIVDFRQSPSYKLASYLNWLLNPVMNDSKYECKNSEDFVKKLQHMKVKRGHKLTSFDVKSMFTKIPIERTLKFMHKKLSAHTEWKSRTKLELGDVIMLTQICMEGTFFEWNNNFYTQTEGTAMGSPLSSVFFEFCMQELEESLIPTLPSIQFWNRYVDDVFSVCREKDLPPILDKLNSFDPTIQFTQEIEQEKKLPFLDVLIEIKKDFSLGFSIYRKPTHTDKYLSFLSNHPMAHKMSVVDTLVKRAINICDSDKLDAELDHIRNVLVANKYPLQVIEKRIERMKSQATTVRQPKDETIKRVAFPYIGNVTTRIAHAIRSRSDIEVCYKPCNKLSTMLSNNKQKLPDQVGIYRLPCNVCPKICIGETGRSMQIRVREHLADIRKNKTTSGPYNHILQNPTHSFDPNSATMIENERGTFRRKFLESLYITKSENYNCNLEKGLEINSIWSALLLKFIQSP